MTRLICFEGLGFGSYIRRYLIEPLLTKYSLNVTYHHWLSRGPVRPKGKVICIGHSFGGPAALSWANRYGCDLLITLDPRARFTGYPILGFTAPDSADVAVNFYQTSPLRGYPVRYSQNITVPAGHTLVPKRPKVRALLEEYLK